MKVINIATSNYYLLFLIIIIISYYCHYCYYLCYYYHYLCYYYYYYLSFIIINIIVVIIIYYCHYNRFYYYCYYYKHFYYRSRTSFLQNQNTHSIRFCFHFCFFEGTTMKMKFHNLFVLSLPSPLMFLLQFNQSFSFSLFIYLGAICCDYIL